MSTLTLGACLPNQARVEGHPGPPLTQAAGVHISEPLDRVASNLLNSALVISLIPRLWTYRRHYLRGIGLATLG